jgi:hypothetical protein
MRSARSAPARFDELRAGLFMTSWPGSKKRSPITPPQQAARLIHTPSCSESTRKGPRLVSEGLVRLPGDSESEKMIIESDAAAAFDE